MAADERDRFIEFATNEQKERKLLQAQTRSVLLLQAVGKGLLARRRFASSIREDFDSLFGGFVNMEKRELVDCKDVLQLGRLFIRIFEQSYDIQASL
uniref:Uncharacterized protein n=1 Tax=Setaria digitata TaxID=48799 RepID=A0A915PY50_9BILA